jgi:hypothetical protein
MLDTGRAPTGRQHLDLEAPPADAAVARRLERSRRHTGGVALLADRAAAAVAPCNCLDHVVFSYRLR